MARSSVDARTQAGSAARRALWADRLRRQRASGLTVVEFCRQEGVSQPSFYQWKRKLAEPGQTDARPNERGNSQDNLAASQDRRSSRPRQLPAALDARAKQPATRPAFLPLLAPTPTPLIVAKLPGGVRLELPAEMLPARLTTLFAALLEAGQRREATSMEAAR